MIIKVNYTVSNPIIKITYDETPIYVSTTSNPIYVSVNYGSSGGNGTVTSVGLTMPSGFVVSNSPIIDSGDLIVTGAGNTSQYLRGDGTLATFPTTISSEDLIKEVYNESGSTMAKGTVVYINGSHGNLPTIAKALATTDGTSAQTLGLVQDDITHNNNGYIVIIGNLIDIDTQVYPNGTQLYLSGTTAGDYTSTKQYAPIHLVYVGIVVRSHPTQGIISVKVQNGFELDELHNVSAQSPSNNDGIFYNSSTSLWEKNTIAGVLGYTPYNFPSLTNGSILFSNGTTLAQDNSNLFWDDTNNRLGIGTNTPAYTLDLTGTSRFTGDITFNTGNFVKFTNHTVPSDFIGGTTTVSCISANTDLTTYTGADATGSRYGIYSRIYSINNGLANLPVYGGFFQSYMSSPLTTGILQPIGVIIGAFRNNANDIGTNSSNTIIGALIQTTQSNATASILTTNLMGVDVTNTVDTGTATNVFGVRHNISLSQFTNRLNSIVTNSYGFYSKITCGTTSGPTGTITNSYGVYLATPTIGATGTITNRWSLYSQDPLANMVHFGSVQIGTSTIAGYKLDVNGTARIQSKLSLSAGTTSNAQINLAASTAPTTPNNGDIWFDGTDIKMRIGGVTKTFTLV